MFPRRRPRPRWLQRLLRYCARPPVALERLEQLGEDALIYRFDQPQPDGRTQLRLTPLQLIERLAALIPPRACTATAITGCWTEFTSPDDTFRAWSSDHSMSQSGRQATYANGSF